MSCLIFATDYAKQQSNALIKRPGAYLIFGDMHMGAYRIINRKFAEILKEKLTEAENLLSIVKNDKLLFCFIILFYNSCNTIS